MCAPLDQRDGVRCPEDALLFDDLDASPERQATGDLLGGVFRARVVPCRIGVFGAGNAQAVIVGGAFPRTDRGLVAGLQEGLIDRGQRKVVIAFDNDRVIGFRDYFVIPDCFHCCVSSGEFKGLDQIVKTDMRPDVLPHHQVIISRSSGLLTGRRIN